MSEIIKPVEDVSWIGHRKKHIMLLKDIFSKMPVMHDDNIIKESGAESEITDSQKEEKTLTDSEKIYNMISEMDKGDGAQVSLILESCERDGIRNAEKSIQMMLEMGDIFEIKAGRVKIL